MTQQPYRRVYQDGTMFKISKAGFHADLAAEKDLLLSITGRSVQIIDRGIAMLTSLVVTKTTWSGTLTLNYPDNGAIPLFILEPYCLGTTYNADGTTVFSQTPRYFDCSASANAFAPASMVPTTLTNTKCVVNVNGAAQGQNSSTGVPANRLYVAGFNYMILRKGVTT